MENDVRDKYLELAKSGIEADDFYKRLRSDGVGKFDAFVVLRDGFNLNLAECTAVSERCEGAEEKPPA